MESEQFSMISNNNDDGDDVHDIHGADLDNPGNTNNNIRASLLVPKINFHFTDD